MDVLEQILFIDIETVPVGKLLADLHEDLQVQWEKRAVYLKSNANPNADGAQLFEEKAGIFSEFAKIVCIGIGCLVPEDGGWKMVLKSIAAHDEKILLNRFCEALAKFVQRAPQLRFCGHNIKEFDIPFISRRMIINGMTLPECMQHQGKKPWEVPHIDTMNLWSFGDKKNFTSLALLAAVLGIPSPKEDMDGSEVSRVYWEEKDLDRISRYCLRDVYTTAKVYLRLQNIPIDPRPEYLTA